MTSKRVVEIWIPYEGIETEEYDTPQEALAVAKKQTEGSNMVSQKNGQEIPRKC